jgi:anti-sigma B factor antagonist
MTSMTHDAAAATALALSSSQRADATVVRVVGEVDVDAAPVLRRYLIELIAAGTRRLVVDLGEVGFLDSTGLGTFIGARKRLRAYRGSLELAALQPSVRTVFTITGLDRSFTIHPRVDDAFDDETGDGS